MHAALIASTHRDRLVGHISRDSTVIEARETRVAPPKDDQPKRRRGRPRKGEDQGTTGGPRQSLSRSDHPFRLVIVRDMWLRGFDAPSLHTMYIDKPMRGHGLMQAIARVNRVFKDKPGGLVVDYLGLTQELKQALETNDSAVKVLGDETLRGIARELVETVRNNVTIDWTIRESVRAQLRVLVKRILRKHGYPPDKQEKATQTVLEQAALLSAGWAS